MSHTKKYTLKELVLECYEEVIQEKKLTKHEQDLKEKIVKKLKSKYPEFKQKYGERAKEVMYAVATKMAEKK